MRLLTLPDVLPENLPAARRGGDASADRVAARIVNDVRRRGDAALFSWSRRLDKLRLTPATVWVDRREYGNAWRDVSPELRNALKHAARNNRRAAEQQRPRPRSEEH